MLTEGEYQRAADISRATQQVAPKSGSAFIQATAQEGRAWARLGAGPATRAGRLFVQGIIDGRPSDDVHGAGWRLITTGVETRAIDPAARTWFESIGGRIVPLPSPDATYRRWFTEHDTACALQRPDFRLCGTHRHDRRRPLRAARRPAPAPRGRPALGWQRRGGDATLGVCGAL